MINFQNNKTKRIIASVIAGLIVLSMVLSLFVGVFGWF